MAQGAKAQSGESKAVPPRWYTVDETRHILKCMNYSDEIAIELSTWIVRHLQLAFSKGFEKGARWRASPAAPSVEQDERGTILRDLMRHASEVCDHTPESFSRGVIKLANRARAASTSTNVAQGAEAREQPTPVEYETAVETLRHVIDCLRKNGSYTDEEGEATDYLEPLLSIAASTAQTALTERVLTYRNQPDNVAAWRLGEACQRAVDLPAGDYIDRGLVLLKELQAKGYGVITLATNQQEGGEQR